MKSVISEYYNTHQNYTLLLYQDSSGFFCLFVFFGTLKDSMRNRIIKPFKEPLINAFSKSVHMLLYLPYII